MAEHVGGAFYNHMAVANEVMKNQKIRIGRGFNSLTAIGARERQIF